MLKLPPAACDSKKLLGRNLLLHLNQFLFTPCDGCLCALSRKATNVGIMVASQSLTIVIKLGAGIHIFGSTYTYIYLLGFILHRDELYSGRRVA